MPRLALTDRFVAGAKAGTKPQNDYFDSKTPGLALRVSSGGHKAWSFIFTNSDGKRSRMTEENGAGIAGSMKDGTEIGKGG